MKIRVLLVDDQSLFREGLRTLLSVWDDIDVVAEAGNGKLAIEAVATHTPDVVLMDLRMPVMGGVAATQAITRSSNTAKVIVLTTFDDDDDVFNALRAGAVGYLLKDVSSDKLVDAIRATARGESILQPSVAAKLVAEFARLSSAPSPAKKPSANADLLDPLSERELQILAHIAQGAGNKEIAAALFLAQGTVKNYVTQILSKLGVRDRTQAALLAREKGLI